MARQMFFAAAMKIVIHPLSFLSHIRNRPRSTKQSTFCLVDLFLNVVQDVAEKAVRDTVKVQRQSDISRSQDSRMNCIFLNLDNTVNIYSIMLQLMHPSIL